MPSVGLINEIIVRTAGDGMEDGECLKFRICRTAFECCEVSKACMGNRKHKKFQAYSKEIIKGSDLKTCEKYKLPSINSLQILDLSVKRIQDMEGQGCWKGEYFDLKLSNATKIRCENSRHEKVCVIDTKQIQYSCNTRFVPK